IVQIFVGPEKQAFQVHSNLICSVSHFFEKAFNDGCVEGTENKMDLPKDAPKTVLMFVAWLYNK
ncbi:uncharacterized protein K444DRAFT_504244, partial [Hyaloscypha bicolor E]